MYESKRNYQLLRRASLLLLLPLMLEITIISVFIGQLSLIDQEKVKQREWFNMVLFPVNLQLDLLEGCPKMLVGMIERGGVSEQSWNEQFGYSMERKWHDFIKRSNLISADTTEIDKHLARFKRAMKSQGNEREVITFQEVKAGEALPIEVLQLMRAIEDVMNKHVVELHASERRVMSLNDQFKSFILIAMVLSILMSVFLSFNLTSFIIKRIKTIEDNTRRLMDEEPLLPPMRGKDELVVLDSFFHKMALSLEEARRKDQALFENSIDVICSIDENFSFIRVSPSSLSRLGYGHEELSGKPITDFIESNSIGPALDAFDRVRKTDTSEYVELGVKRADGTVSHCILAVDWSKEDKTYACVIHDLSERKAAERKRQELVACVSHDLRSPLTTVQFALDVIASDEKNLPEESYKEIIETKEEVERTVEMISELLLLAKLDAHQVTPQLTVVPLAKLIEDLNELISADLRVDTQASQKNARVLLESNHWRRVVDGMVRYANLFGHGEYRAKLVSKSGSHTELVVSWLDAGKIKAESGDAGLEISLALYSSLAKLFKGQFLRARTSEEEVSFIFSIPYAINSELE